MRKSETNESETRDCVCVFRAAIKHISSIRAYLLSFSSIECALSPNSTGCTWNNYGQLRTSFLVRWTECSSRGYSGSFRLFPNTKNRCNRIALVLIVWSIFSQNSCETFDWYGDLWNVSSYSSSSPDGGFATNLPNSKYIP